MISVSLQLEAIFWYTVLMRFRHSPRAVIALATLAGVVLLPLCVHAVYDEKLLADTKDQFTELWHSAADATQRRDALEQSLQQYDVKVAQAQKELQEAVQSRKDVRERLSERQKLIDALTAQLKAASDSDLFYRMLAEQERAHFVSFIRYIASKEVALSDAGPVNGKSVVQQVLRGSLGQSVDDELAFTALARARSRFLLQVKVLARESGKAESRLKAIAAGLTTELRQLQDQNQEIGSEVDRQSKLIDASWRQRKLTEQELKDVAQEAAEANDRMASMQASLLEINTALKDQRLRELDAQLKAQETKRSALASDVDALQRKDEALRMLEDAALRAMQQALQLKNTDKKLYKRIGDAELQIKNDKATLQSLEVARGTGSTVPSDEEDRLQQEISFLSEQVDLMEQGIPFDAAEEQVRTRRQAVDAKEARKDIALKLPSLKAQLARATKDVSTTVGEIDSVKLQSGLEGLPPMFGWPVKGPLTATYLDSDYVQVFGVPHRAIDIGTPQGSPIHAVADGIVYAVKDGGATGYSYVLIGHRNGYASLYGHVSVFMVKKGDVVRFGQTIALSGGTPGTHGAGHMTTGPHLHLEMTKNGAHINPLSVLPGK
jgi:murein DD-endopeptidase MepM/ murein hydrolase activator NlpD